MSQTKIDPFVRTRVFDLAQHPRDPRRFQCAGCRKYFARTALQIDHIKPEVESFPEDRSDEDNFQLLCAPKGSTRLTSCHKRKTAREHADRARRNRIPRRWTPAFLYGSACTIVGGYTWQEVFRQDHAQAIEWVQHSGGILGAVFCTYLVQKAWRRRRPRRSISAEPVSASEPGQVLDTQRIVEAAREIIGPRGDVRVLSTETDQAFTLTYSGTGFPDHEDDKRYDLLGKIQAKLGDRWRPEWDTRRDRVRFVRRPVLARMIRHPGFEEDRKWNEIPIAPEVSFDLLNTPHILIIGTTGAGKTALMRTIIAAVVQSAATDDNTRLILADPKQIEMPGFAGWPGVRDIVWQTEDLWEMAFDLEREMNERAALIRLKKAKPSDFRRIICVIDEYEQFFKRMKRHWESGKDEDGNKLKVPGQRVPGAIDAIQSVLSMARRMNIHLIIGTQSPDANWFGGTGTRENMSGRAAAGPLDQHRAKMMFDDSSVGRDIPIEFKGRCTIQVGDGAPKEVQVYYTPDPFDPDEANTADDWATLLRLGMPETQLPDQFSHLKEAA